MNPESAVPRDVRLPGLSPNARSAAHIVMSRIVDAQVLVKITTPRLGARIQAYRLSP